MLTELKVSRFAIIDNIHIFFDHGLNILSGETGAGKSVLIRTLALLMGAKPSNQDIRSNADEASIQGVFDLSNRRDVLERLHEMGIESEENQLIIRRLLKKNGKSRVYLNGQPCTVSNLRRIVFPTTTQGHLPLIEITGQHESRDLISTRRQIDILDEFSASVVLRGQVSQALDNRNQIQREMEELKTLCQQREQQMDFLDFQIKEIEALNLREDEDVILEKKIKDLKQKQSWQHWIQETSQYLQNSNTSVLDQLKQILKQAPDHCSLTTPKEQISQALLLLEDATFGLQQQIQGEQEQEKPLEKLEERLSRLRKIQKKFGSGVPKILEQLEQMKQEHDKLHHLSENLENLEKTLTEHEQKLSKLCQKLSEKRNSGAQELARKVNRDLKDLNMQGLEFLIGILPQEISSMGRDRVVFQTKSGKKEDARELIQATSGGELSRILLSLKQVVGDNNHPRTFLFDEVDSGVSGVTAEKVGARLKKLARHQQVICVTHLPQVASFGDHHFLIEKQTKGDSVGISVTVLDKKQRIREIARLISGQRQTKTSIAHARELLRQNP